MITSLLKIRSERGWMNALNQAVADERMPQTSLRLGVRIASGFERNLEQRRNSEGRWRVGFAEKTPSNKAQRLRWD